MTASSSPDPETDADADADATDDADADDPVAGEQLSVLEAAAADIGWPDFEAENNARELLQGLEVPAVALGRLQELVVWLAGAQTRCPPLPARRVRVVVFAADHGIAASVQPPGDIPALSIPARARALAAGHGPAAIFAPSVGAGVRIVDMGLDLDVDQAEPGGDRVRPSSGRIDEGTALSEEEAEGAVAIGARIADEEVDGGADLLIAASMGAGADIVAAALVSVLTNTEPVKALGLDSRLDDATWMRALTVVRDAHRFGAESRYDTLVLLSRIGGADVAALTGFLLRAAARRTPVLLDGPVACAAALAARDVAPRAIRWWQAGSSSPVQAHRLALEELQLQALLDLDLSFDQGVGALLAVPLLTAAVHAATDLRAAPPLPDV